MASDSGASSGGDVCPVTGHAPEGGAGACPVMADGASGYGAEWMQMHNPHKADPTTTATTQQLSTADHPDVNDFFPPDSSPYPDQKVALSPISARSRIPKGQLIMDL